MAPVQAWRNLPATVGLVVGLFMACYPMILSAGDAVPGDSGDARLVNYLLEHTYLWLKQEPLHSGLWSLPIFYPEPNTGAYSDVLLGAGPLYWCWRLLGLGPDTAFQLWLIAVIVLNYVCAYMFLRRCLRLGPLAGAFGAFLFAFASPRLAQLCHAQLQAQFWSVLCCYALWRVFQAAGGSESKPPSRLRPRAWIWLFFLSTVGQIYTSYYLGWFLALGLTVAAGWGLATSRGRAHLIAIVRLYPGTLLLGSVMAAVPLADMAHHYLEAARRTGWANRDAVMQGIPAFGDWLSRGPGTLLQYPDIPGDVAMPERTVEHALGLGLVTTVVAALGLYQARRRETARLLLLASFTIFLVVTAWGPERSLWQAVYPCVPGGAAIRALGRVVLLLLLPAAVGAAYWVQKQRRLALVLPLIGLCVLEQARVVPTYSKGEHRQAVARVAAQIVPGCRAFYLVPTEPGPGSAIACQLDAMWAGLEASVPTVNGYSGRFPPGWHRLLGTEPVASAVRAGALRAWLARNGVPAATMLVIDSRLGDYGSPESSGTAAATSR
jgi:hypothetical protein